jgi:non-heme chloroperoxidase
LIEEIMSFRQLGFVMLMGVAGCGPRSLVPPGGDQADPGTSTMPGNVPPPNSDGLIAMQVNGVELHVRDRGEGEAIVFVHGGLADYREWVDVADRLSDGYRTITYSRRYNHPNDNPLLGSNHSAAVEGEDLSSLIRGLGLDSVHLVGVSYGAYTALHTALRHPQLVRSLTLVEASLVAWARDLDGGAPLYEEFMGMWSSSAEAFSRDDPVAALRSAVDWFVAPGVFDQVPPDFLATLMGNAREWRALTTSTAAFLPVTPDEVRDVVAPVLMISGGRSRPLFRLLDDELEQRFRHVRRIVVPEGTHDVCSEEPETCASAIRAFLAAP